MMKLKLPAWTGRQNSDEFGQASTDTKNLLLGGRPAAFRGNPEDPYFQDLAGHAAALNGLNNFITRQILPGAEVIDVGANIGLSTVLMARHFKHVIALEPSPTNAEFLRQNLSLNKITNVDVIEAAASSSPGKLHFHVAQFGAGSHVVAAGHVLQGTIPSIDVTATTLDEMNLPQIGFIKIDAEGHEPDVVAGAAQLLERDQPLIYTEINLWCLSAFAGHSLGAFVKTLWNHFEVSQPQEDGNLTACGDPYGFLHDAIVHHKGISDIVLQLKKGCPAPSLSELTWPPAARLAIDDLKAKLRGHA